MFGLRKIRAWHVADNLVFSELSLKYNSTKRANKNMKKVIFSWHSNQESGFQTPKTNKLRQLVLKVWTLYLQVFQCKWKTWASLIGLRSWFRGNILILPKYHTNIARAWLWHIQPHSSMEYHFSSFLKGKVEKSCSHLHTIKEQYYRVV